MELMKNILIEKIEIVFDDDFKKEFAKITEGQKSSDIIKIILKYSELQDLVIKQDKKKKEQKEAKQKAAEALAAKEKEAKEKAEKEKEEKEKAEKKQKH